MNILNQKKLIKSIYPFELLSSLEIDLLMKKIDISYYPKKNVLISKTTNAIAFLKVKINLKLA